MRDDSMPIVGDSRWGLGYAGTRTGASGVVFGGTTRLRPEVGGATRSKSTADTLVKEGSMSPLGVHVHIGQVLRQ